MKTFIEPEKINVLCDNYGRSNTNTNENNSKTKTSEKAESKQSAWTKIKSKVKWIWEKVKPTISGLTMLLTSVTALLKAINKFRTQYKNAKEAFA